MNHPIPTVVDQQLLCIWVAWARPTGGFQARVPTGRFKFPLDPLLIPGLA